MMTFFAALRAGLRPHCWPSATHVRGLTATVQNRHGSLGAQDAHTINMIVEALLRAKAVLFVTGAGLSADSGLPTYRGDGGL